MKSGLFPEVQPLPALQVAEASGGATAAERAPALPVGYLAGGAVLALALAAFLFIRRPFGLLPAAGAVAVMIMVGVFAYQLRVPSLPADAAQSVDSAAGTTGAVETGRRLFLAKGCVVCHVNDRVMDGAGEYSLEVGPNLTRFPGDPAYLGRFLESPAAVKHGSPMPDLGLSEGEIEALVAFLVDQE